MNADVRAIPAKAGTGTETISLSRRSEQPGLRIGVVGCGYWGSKHVRVLSGLPEVATVAVIEQDEKIRSAIRTAFPSVVPFADLETALDHIDAIIVATPPLSHAEVALKALAAGRHVLIEKPVTRTLDEARTLVDAAAEAGVVLMAGHTFEFNPAVQELRRRLEQDELGEPYYLHSARLNLGLYRSDVDVVWDLAPHDISIMNYLLRSTPTRVSAWGSANACQGMNDLAYIQLHYEDVGVTGYIHVSWLDPRKVRRVTVVGSRKMAVYDDVADERLRIFDCGVKAPGVDVRAGLPGEDDLVPYDRPFAYHHGDIVSPRLPDDEPLAQEDRHFVECILKRVEPCSGGASGMAVVAVLEAIDRAMIEGGPVAVTMPPEVALAVPGQPLTAGRAARRA